MALLLPRVPRQTPEGEPQEEPFLPVVYNDVEDECVMTDVGPTVVPALVVYADSPVEVPATTPTRRHGTVELMVTYVTREWPMAQARRQGGLVLRAVRESLTAWNRSRRLRELNGLKILAVENVTEYGVAGAVGRSQLWGFVTAQVTVLEEPLP